MNCKILKNKKGIGLAECVVALLIFSIISATVITVFSNSREQIKKQNEQFESDLLQNNLISAYSAANNYNEMASFLGWNERSNADEIPTVPASTDNSGGTVPKPVSFSKIKVDKKVDKEVAEFKDSNGNNLISFEGTYDTNQLTSTQIPNDYYTETPVTIPRKMVLKGTAKRHDYTYTVTEDKVKFEMGKGGSERNTTDLDKYLLSQQSYLRCCKECEYNIVETSRTYNETYENFWGQIRTRTVTDYTYKKYCYFYFEVFDKDNNSTGKFYCISIITDTHDSQRTRYDLSNWMSYAAINAKLSGIDTFNTTISDYNDGKINETNLNAYLDLSKCTIKTYSGNNCPSYLSFTTELTASGYYFKSGNWYFAPWLTYKTNDRDQISFTPTCNSFEPGRTYYEYTPKEGKAGNIYYALNKTNDKDIEIYDSDSVKIFSYTNQTKSDLTKEKSTAILNAATDACGIKKITTTKYSDINYDVWYKKGGMPQTKINGVSSDDTKREIVFKSGDNPVIRFLYGSDNTNYTADEAKLPTINAESDFTFSCESFSGKYTIWINDNVFISNATHFEIKGSTDVADSNVSVGMYGEPAIVNTNAQVYYVTCTINNTGKSLVAKIVFCDLAKPKETDNGIIEPRIDIWSIDTVNIPSQLNSISNDTNAVLERSYRKG